MTAPKIPQQNPLAVVDEQARNAAPFIEHFTPGFEDPKRIAAPAAAATSLDLGRNLVLDAETAYLLGLVTQPVDHSHSFDLAQHENVPAGGTTEVDPLAVLREYSVCARAGARIIVAKAPPAEVRGDLQVMYEQDALLRSVDPAPFALVADAGNASISAKPLHDATFSWGAVPSYAFRAVISRAERRAVGGDQLRQALAISVLQGLGELADSLLLSAIQAATPAAFSFGAAAARHARFDELRAVIGTGGTGAEVLADGSLRAAGVLAELSAVTDATVIGRFTRSMIAIRPELRVLGHRVNQNGDVELTVFCNMQALASNPADFWVAA